MSIPPPELTFHPNNKGIAVLDGAVQILNTNEDFLSLGSREANCRCDSDGYRPDTLGGNLKTGEFLDMFTDGEDTCPTRPLHVTAVPVH